MQDDTDPDPTPLAYRLVSVATTKSAATGPVARACSARHPSKAQAPAKEDMSFVTANRDDAVGMKVLGDQFARGMKDGMHPLAYDRLRASHLVNNDTTTYSIGGVSVHVSGLTMLQTTDPEGLGYDMGRELYRLFALANPAVPGPRKPAQTEADTRQGVVRTALQDRLEDIGQGVSEEECAKASKASPEEWRAAAAYQGPPAQGEPCVLVTMTKLSTVLHEVAGQASMCWDPRPKGVFDSDKALSVVAQALERLSHEPQQAPRKPAQTEGDTT